MELVFPGSSGTNQRFKLEIIELEARVPTLIGSLKIMPFVVDHDGVAPFYAYRIEVDNRILAYSGDTEWRAELIEVGREADVFICEAYFYEKRVRMHLDLKTLEKYLPQIQPKRLILTHMSDDMLQRIQTIDYETAEDGKVINL
jgi:ribonuclease BN (tRNA processing enzyme)